MKRFEYKKVIGFTLQQKRAFEVLEEHGVNYPTTKDGWALEIR